MARLLLLLLAACGASPDVVLAFAPAHGTPLTFAQIGSLEVFVYEGAPKCAELATRREELTILRRQVLTLDALKLERLPSGAPVTIVADAYAAADAIGEVIGSACAEAVRIEPGGRTQVVLSL